jgi:hypothetical protein
MYRYLDRYVRSDLRPATGCRPLGSGQHCPRPGSLRLLCLPSRVRVSGSSRLSLPAAVRPSAAGRTDSSQQPAASQPAQFAAD